VFLGHLDVVAPWSSDAFKPRITDGRMYGRGAADMKSGLAAALVAIEALTQDHPLAGDVYFAGVIDEEWASLGTQAFLSRYHPDAAVIPECTDLTIVSEHGGFAWYEIESHGVEAPGVDSDHGVDAISLLAPVLVGLTRLDAELAQRPHASYGRASVHASTIEGGKQFPAYPARCVLGVERCLIAGETVDQAQAELDDIIAAARAADPRFRGELRTVVARQPLTQSPDEPVVAAASAAVSRVLGRPTVVHGDIAWGDSGLLAENGIPCATFGPIGRGEHTAEEWVDLSSVASTAAALAVTAQEFCR
jgi:acetylornithine deacetylase